MSVDELAQGRVDRALKEWRERLLDLSRKNPLLYLNSSKATKIRIKAPTPATLYELLVMKEKTLTFPSLTGRTAEEEEVADHVSEFEDASRSMREEPGDLDIDYTAGSARNVEELQRKLRRLEKNASASVDEQGVNTLFIALGVLEWRESQNATGYEQAPLILLPVSLALKKGGAYQLSCSEPDPRQNSVLELKLRRTYGIDIPALDNFLESGRGGSDLDLAAYFAKVEGIVGPLGFKVSDDVWIAHFAFEKLAMYEDLGLPDTRDAIEKHEVLSAIVARSAYERKPIPSELKPPDAFARPQLFPVLPADHSQLEVLAEVAAGNSLVVQGPPGTGKSQTIANLIAQALRLGKTVLFVSEKRAALDVVYRRLEEAQLARFCLELHSHRAQKSSVASALAAELDSVDNNDVPAACDEEFVRLRELSDRLNEYVQVLHAPRGAAGLTAYQVHSELAHLAAIPEVQAQLPTRSLAINRAQEQTMRSALRAIKATEIWDTEPVHPWRDSAPSGPSHVIGAELKRNLQGAIAGLQDLVKVGARLRDEFGSSLMPRSIGDVPRVRKLLEHLRHPSPFPQDSYKPASSAQSAARETSRLLAGVLDLDPRRDMLERFCNRYRRWYQRLSASYRRDQREINRVSGRRMSWQDALYLLAARDRYEQALVELCDDPSAISDPVAQDLSPDRMSSTLIPLLVWMGSLAWNSNVIVPMDVLATLLRRGQLAVDAAHALEERIGQLSSQLDDHLEGLARLFPQGLDGRALESDDLNHLHDRLNDCLEHFTLLDEWRAYLARIDEAKQYGLEPYLRRARELELSADQLELAFVKLLRLKWLTEVYEDCPALRDFDSRNHERVIEEFCDLDRKLIERARDVVSASLHERRATAGAALFPESGRAHATKGSVVQGYDHQRVKEQGGIVRREAGKKRRHLPIRRLLPNVADLALLLKPCFLMSPLSIATYLPRDRFRFDLVIFDEASQVLPEDAVGAVLRAEQAVFFGDSKQLPPTSFFRRTWDDDDDGEDDDEDAVGGFESILDLAGANLPRVPLRWHYRSRDERLIAFSNARFYAEAPLITFPSPYLGNEDTGVRFILCPDGYWERKLKRNLVEARRVVELVIEHLESRHERSLGVIALGLSQAETIELELNRALLDRPDLAARRERYNAEPFFVKNLENVQGDERDEIILSIGYGPEIPGGPVPLRFGPINNLGGERRLNVAVTRARYRTTVVASFRPDALLRTGELKPGPRYLHEYLLYAERGGRDAASPTLDPNRGPESEFEEAVADALRGRGYDVDFQVGASGYRIDLAVKDRLNPGRYVLAIECDGATYHSAPAARDRDRLRQEQLEALGWRFHRIWSTDWIRDPEGTLERAVQAIERALSNQDN